MVSSALVLSLCCTSIAQIAKLTRLYSFDGRAGANPIYASLVQGQDGLLYGATVYGGDKNLGAIFKIDTLGNITTLHSFSGSDGSYPWGGLILGLDGDFYGTTPTGGLGGFGIIYRISSEGNFAVLHNFLSYPTGGGYPYLPPILAADGSFYGVTEIGGPQNAGILYRITGDGRFNVLYNFSSGFDTIFSPVQGPNGNLYVTTIQGGADNCGSLAEISTRGVLVSQFSFDCTTDGKYPLSSLTLAADGNFYGVTDQGGADSGGVLFKVSKNLDFTVVHDFNSGANDGIDPEAGLVEATNGKLYGVTLSGGSRDLGTIYSVSRDGSIDNIVSWTVEVQAQAAMVQHTNGVLYGLTYEGGNYGMGMVYSLRLGLGPFISFVLPTGKVGQTAQILGQGLTGTTSVTFNGVAATFSVVSDTYMTAVVPAGATTGTVVVATPAGNLTSNVSFRISK
jgi:uncharacterized repeat protein (TIGR03803 family)